MPDAILVMTAEAVVVALNTAKANTFNHEFTAERSYADWELPLEESAPVDRVLVDVTPVPPLDMELQTRDAISYKPSVDIIVRRRVTTEQREANGKIKLAELDKLVMLVQQIAEFFIAERLATFQEAAWESTEIRRAFVPAHLHKNHQFTGQVRVTFNTANSM